ncbi:MAG: Rid family hydrolase [Planctomycetota bacterium]|jgi:enamine deaminase RidA (YjgF/YER057c/UK114 family)
MSTKIHTYVTESVEADEIYISTVPEEQASLEQQAKDIFSGISDILRSKKAYILQERIFANSETMATICNSRLKAYGDINDGVLPSLLSGKEQKAIGPIDGVQIYAICHDKKPEIFNFENTPCGRIIRTSNRAYLATSHLLDTKSPQITEQMQTIFKKTGLVLKLSGVDIFSVPRTWMWLGDILSWYDQFNEIRNKFFKQWGALGDRGQFALPASTGIGIRPTGGGKCAMEFTAILKPANAIRYLLEGGRQQSAFDYGSAFSRASSAITPAGKTVFISGTASIDANGNTTNIGNAEKQIKATIENVRAVLKDMNCSNNDVVQIMAYCKNAAVVKVFNRIKEGCNWPWVTVICDICRDDLFFEVEATAMPNAKKISK